MPYLWDTFCRNIHNTHWFFSDTDTVTVLHLFSPKRGSNSSDEDLWLKNSGDMISVVVRKKEWTDIAVVYCSVPAAVILLNVRFRSFFSPLILYASCHHPDNDTRERRKERGGARPNPNRCGRCNEAYLLFDIEYYPQCKARGRLCWIFLKEAEIEMVGCHRFFNILAHCSALPLAPFWILIE